MTLTAYAEDVFYCFAFAERKGCWIIQLCWVKSAKAWAFKPFLVIWAALSHVRTSSVKSLPVVLFSKLTLCLRENPAVIFSDLA